MKVPITLVVLTVTTLAQGATLPGFRPQLLGVTTGFLSSIVTDGRGTIYYTTTAGNIFRFEPPQSSAVAQVTTDATGNSGLLGMALRDDRTAVVHYTTPNQTFDVIASIDLTTGTETLIHAFQCDKDVAERGTSPEHHGGNPIVAADGSIFVPIGDGGGGVSQLVDWNLGKIFRIFPDSSVDQFARGVRNPFDLSWDAANQRLIVPDNGDTVNDEINIAHQGDNLGWPDTMGNQPSISGDVAPIYSFPMVVAPTGIVALSGRNSMLPRGYLLSAYVTRALYYIPDIDARPFPAPIALIAGETDPIVDVTEGPAGEVYFGTGRAIYRLIVPQRGDCNADGLVSTADLTALETTLADRPVQSTLAATVSWGCDVNGDGLIDARDITALKALLGLRSRAVRSH